MKTTMLRNRRQYSLVATLLITAWAAHFQTLTANAGPPTITNPGSPTSPGPTVANLTPQFTWNAVSGATGYGLYIRDMTASGTPLVYPNAGGTTGTPLTGTSFNLPSG